MAMGALHEPVFVAADTRVEPLVNGFRAWPHLVAPHTYAANLRAKHLPWLNSAVEASDDAQRRRHLRQLIDEIEQRRSALCEFGAAILHMDTTLVAEAKGYSLETLYGRVPKPLQGLVELVYDRYNQPGMRFLEAALYRSSFYDPTLQSLLIERTDPELAGEGLRVPRVPTDERVLVDHRFDGPAWDAIGAARRRAVPLGDLAATIGVTERQLQPFVTSRPPRRVSVDPHSPQPRARFFGHACVLIESAEAAVLVDPLIGRRSDGGDDRFSFADLPDRIDCVAITHAHLDHFDIESLLQIRHLVDVIVVPRVAAGDLVDPSLRLVLEAIGFSNVVELDDFQSLPLPGGKISAVPFFGEHGDLTVRGKAGYAVSLGGKTAVLLADSQCVEPAAYLWVRDFTGPISALFLGMECEGSPMSLANGPYLPEGLHTKEMAQSRRTKGSNAAEAMALVTALRTGTAYVYAMGLEPWLAFMFGVPDPSKSYSLRQVDLFLERCAEAGLAAELLRAPRVMSLS